MNKQFAVFGIGRFGESVAINLQKQGCEVIAVDSDKERIEDIAEHVSFAIQADFSEIEVMKTLGARNLDGVVVAVAGNMESSVMATLVAKEVGVPFVLAKAQNELHAKALRKIGADVVVFPEKEMGERIAKDILSTSFVDWIALSPEYSLAEDDIPEEWVGKSLRELEVRTHYNVNVVGLKKDDKVEVNIDPDRPLEKDTLLILIGANEDLGRLQSKQEKK